MFKILLLLIAGGLLIGAYISKKRDRLPFYNNSDRYYRTAGGAVHQKRSPRLSE
jgi:hypothetical protein